MNKYFLKKCRLYCGFVDFKCVFDIVDRVKMWNKILMYGIRGKFLKILCLFYNNIKFCVLLDGKLLDFFVNNFGVL